MKTKKSDSYLITQYYRHSHGRLEGRRGVTILNKGELTQNLPVQRE